MMMIPGLDVRNVNDDRPLLFIIKFRHSAFILQQALQFFMAGTASRFSGSVIRHGVSSK